MEKLVLTIIKEKIKRFTKTCTCKKTYFKLHSIYYVIFHVCFISNIDLVQDIKQRSTEKKYVVEVLFNMRSVLLLLINLFLIY